MTPTRQPDKTLILWILFASARMGRRQVKRRRYLRQYLHVHGWYLRIKSSTADSWQLTDSHRPKCQRNDTFGRSICLRSTFHNEISSIIPRCSATTWILTCTSELSVSVRLGGHQCWLSPAGHLLAANFPVPTRSTLHMCLSSNW